MKVLSLIRYCDRSTVRAGFQTSCVGRDSCLLGTDIVLWPYIHAQRAHKSFHLLVEGQLLVARGPLGLFSTKLHLSFQEVELGSSPITTSHHDTPLLLDWLKHLSRIWQLKLNIVTFCYFLSLSFFLWFIFYFLFFWQSVPFHFLAHLLQLRRATRWLEPLGFISLGAVIAREAPALWEIFEQPANSRTSTFRADTWLTATATAQMSCMGVAALRGFRLNW